MNTGWVKLYRALLDWQWYDDVSVKCVFIHLLLSANHAQSYWKGISIGRGQKWTSVGKLAKECGLSEKQVRIAIDKLQKTGEIVSEGASNGTMLTVCKYDTYQSSERTEGEQTGKRGANGGQAEGEQRATNNKNKNIKNDEEQQEVNTNVSPEKDDNVIWVIAVLNKKAGTSFKANAKATQRLINARIKDGYTGNDFKAVITHKVKQWADDPEMSQYLRPSTLFGTKFEAYLNAAKLAQDDKPREFHRPKDPVH